MKNPNRHADPDDLVRGSIGRRPDVRPQRGRSITHTAAIAAIAFGMGALAVTAVLSVREDGSNAPVLASQSPAPNPAMAVEREDALPPRQIRNVLIEPNVDPSARSQDRTRFAERVRPAIEARRADERTTPDPAQEPLAADRQDARVGPRPYVPPRGDTPAEVAMPAAEPLSDTPPALAAASSESAAAPAVARVRSAVNMRSAPDKASEAVGVVPTDALLQVVSCEGWCEVIYDGQRGFVYETFIDGASQ